VYCVQRHQWKSKERIQAVRYGDWTSETHPTRHLGRVEKSNERGDLDVMMSPTKIDAARRMEEDLYA
jgi:hypothetical protein